jgi:hypothetical protein
MEVKTESRPAAGAVGGRESTLLSNIAYWVAKNRAREVNKYEGKYWTYLSTDNIHDRYPYFSKDVIRSILETLERRGLILKGHFGLKNNTCFYTLTEKAEGLFTNRDLHGEGEEAAGGESAKEEEMKLEGKERAAVGAEEAVEGFVGFAGALRAAETGSNLHVEGAPAHAEGLRRERTRRGAVGCENGVFVGSAGGVDSGGVGAGAGAVDYILLAVGVGCLLMSIRNSWLYLTGAGFSGAGALVTAVITAGFTAAAFSVRGVLIKGLAVLVIAFSVFSTFSVYYANYERDAAGGEELETERTEYERRLGAAVAELAVIEERVEELKGEAAYWREKNWRLYEGFQEDIAGLYEREAGLNEYMLQTAAPVRESGGGTVFAAFEAVADSLGVTAGTLRLLIFLIPAVFFDVASPLLFANFFKRAEVWENPKPKSRFAKIPNLNPKPKLVNL